MPRRTKVSFTTPSGRVTFFKPKPCDHFWGVHKSSSPGRIFCGKCDASKPYKEPLKCYECGEVLNLKCPNMLCPEKEREHQADNDMKAIGIILMLLVSFGYGVVMFFMGYLISQSICTGQLVMMP